MNFDTETREKEEKRVLKRICKVRGTKDGLQKYFLPRLSFFCSVSKRMLRFAISFLIRKILFLLYS